MTYIPIANNPLLARDTASMAIVSTDGKGLQQYRERRYQIKQDQQALASLQNEVKLLKEIVQNLIDKTRPLC